MQGVVKYQRGDGFTELRDVDVRKPNANEVLIEVHSAGICGSDLHIHHDHINLPMKSAGCHRSRIQRHSHRVWFGN